MNKPIRRSLTISESNDIKIQRIRAKLLCLNPPVDMCYTDVVNKLIELGNIDEKDLK